MFSNGNSFNLGSSAASIKREGATRAPVGISVVVLRDGLGIQTMGNPV